jgi:hypothetical protein
MSILPVRRFVLRRSETRATNISLSDKLPSGTLVQSVSAPVWRATECSGEGKTRSNFRGPCTTRRRGAGHAAGGLASVYQGATTELGCYG